jgi:hypothetical protein
MSEQVQIQNIGLLAIAEQLKLIARTFQDIRFTHIYREHNQVADKLSKEGLDLMENHFVLSEFHNGHSTIIRQSNLDVF